MKKLTFFKNSPAAFHMIYVKGGIFEMGGESLTTSMPIHNVRLSDYWIGEFLVTQVIWEQIMKNNPSNFKGKNRPVESISWNTIVQDFLPELNEHTKKERGNEQGFRLPTEAEWEYAARGGIESKGYVYAGGDKIEEVAWCKENSHRETKLVGLKLSNELGLFDMTGNVWEWCQDWYNKRYYESCKREGIINNPNGPKSGSHRILRGGSWIITSEYCRSTVRNGGSSSNRNDYIGFRLVFSPLSV